MLSDPWSPDVGEAGRRMAPTPPHDGFQPQPGVSLGLFRVRARPHWTRRTSARPQLLHISHSLRKTETHCAKFKFLGPWLALGIRQGR